jgi:putative peptide zinc metalloprotease protein
MVRVVLASRPSDNHMVDMQRLLNELVPLRAGHLVGVVDGHTSSTLSPDTMFRRVIVDWREVQTGDLFVAWQNDGADSHRFVPDALARGASAVMVNESWYQHHELVDGPVIVVRDTDHALDLLLRRPQPSTDLSATRVVIPLAVSVPPPVAEYPEREPDIELVGEMQETAFQDRQWLIKRGGHFLQVSELLYRVAEQADGRHTLREIATAVTDATEWIVTDAHVRQIIETKLIPLGVIAATGDDEHQPRPPRPPSPLLLNLRTKVLGPRVIDPVTAVLQHLYAPILLVPLLAVAAIAHWWLYVHYDLQQGIAELIYAPVYTLLMFPVIILGAVCHEFGHAAALRYGGGRARSIGVGLYLIFPAFYTDTTDSYRLGRWGRVRTDLGGFYFHLLFAIGLVAAYLSTGYDFLALAILVINLDMARQLIPFVRLDGYWLLSDLTGIPDLFTQMGSFIRNAATLSLREARKAANLKPWVEKVFLTYLLVTIPVLTFIAVFFISRVPGLVENILHSLSLKFDAVVDANRAGVDSYTALAITEMLLLVLQLFGIAFMLSLLGRRIVGVLWRGVRHPAPLIQASSVVGAVALVFFLVRVWIQ